MVIKRFVVSCVLVGACGSGTSTTKPQSPGTEQTSTAGDETASAEGPAPDAKVDPKSLFARLGGKPAIEAVVNEFVTRNVNDRRVKERFFNTDPVQLNKLLTEFVCMATGGPCKYSGRTMEDSHGGMEVSEDEWNAVVENLVGALDKFKVPEKEKGELLGALGPLKAQIVAPEGSLKPIDAAKLAKVSKLAKTIKDEPAANLLSASVEAGKRGQRSYAEQLFSRAEMIVGAKKLESVATVFRQGAPPRVTTALKKMPKNSKPQPKGGVGGSDDDAPAQKAAAVASLKGKIELNGGPVKGLGVVMLTPLKGGGKKRIAKQRVIEQRDKIFAPHVMAVPIGSTVAFPNFDPIYHNVFSLSGTKPFDLGLYKNGELREVTFDKAGVVRLGCNIHSAMSAFIIVVDAPHYAVADNGAFSFRSLQPGKYKVQAWSEKGGEPMTSEVTIKPGSNDLPLDLKGGAPAGPSPDKFGGSRAFPPG